MQYISPTLIWHQTCKASKISIFVSNPLRVRLVQFIQGAVNNAVQSSDFPASQKSTQGEKSQNFTFTKKYIEAQELLVAL